MRKREKRTTKEKGLLKHFLDSKLKKKKKESK